MLAITSDYVQSLGDPQPYLRCIAEAGFSHLHWCHEWDTDRLYTREEIRQIGAWLKEYGLRLLNLHGSQGREKYWVSSVEAQRLAGIELVRNRLQMTARLGGEVVILHIPTFVPPEIRPEWLAHIRRSLDDIQPFARSHAVRVALENMDGDDFEMLETLLGEYDAGFLGLCYDSGHANLGGLGMKGLERLKERLIAVHLHDNDGLTDQHKLPFTGSIDWTALAHLLAASSYRQCLNLEVIIHETGIQDEAEFLRQAHQAGIQLNQLIHTQLEV
jgi:sugar phosphate isomerase/epimerase